MRKAAGFFFLINLLLPVYTFAQENTSLGTLSDYSTTKVLDKLNNSNFFTFDFEGNYIVAENVSNKQQIVKFTPSGERKVLLEHLTQPLLGLSFYKGNVYVVTRGRVAIIKKGRLADIVSGLPAAGDYANGPVIFNDGKMYFGIGTATNSGIVSSDNAWLGAQTSIHDLSCASLKINQVNYESDNVLTEKRGDRAATGAFAPFNTKNYTDTLARSEKCNGALIQTSPDGSELRVVAYGLHNPKGISFDADSNLYVLDSAMEERGARPVKGGRDAIFKITDGMWYGWPDFSAGLAAGNPLIKDIPNAVPPPTSTFDPGHLGQFVVNEFGSNSGLAIYDGVKVSEFKLDSGKLNDFITVPKDFKVAQIKFGPDNDLYILINNGKVSQLWKVEATHKVTAGGLVGDKQFNLPIAWSISLTVMVIGLLATYLVYHNQEKNLGI